MDTRYASRKFILACATVLLTALARGLGWIDGAQFVALLQWTLGLYMAGNVGDTAAERLGIAPGGKP